LIASGLMARGEVLNAADQRGDLAVAHALARLGSVAVERPAAEGAPGVDGAAAFGREHRAPPLAVDGHR
jgi:hypothetical protein